MATTRTDIHRPSSVDFDPWKEWLRYASTYLGLDPEDETNDNMKAPGGSTRASENSMPLAAPGEEASVSTQQRAQKNAERWYSARAWNREMIDAQDLWHNYQSPSEYGWINRSLRDPDDHTLDAVAERMFKVGGTTTREPMTLYRALRVDNGHNWSKTLAVGSTFQDNGIVSTTAFRRLAQGWLSLDGSSSGNQDAAGIDIDDVVLEVDVPKGARIVGGTQNFIETMLPPGTRFKITRAQRIRTQNAVNPQDGRTITEPVTYTHIKATAVLPPEYMVRMA